MRSCWPFLALVLICCTALCTRESAASELLHRRLKLIIGYHFSSGTYGTSDTTEIAYIPLTLKAEIGRWSLQTTVPYLRISGPAGIVQGPNGPIQTSSGASDGLGDVFTRGSYTLPPWTNWMPFVDMVGVVKFPTASRAKGLGTGEFDFGVESELTWSIGDLTPFAGVGYRFLGSPPDTNLSDVLLGSVGAEYRILEAVNVGLLLDYRQASTVSLGKRLELIPFASWKVDAHWSVDAYASAGLAAGSPNAGVGMQLGYGW